eukprot:SAG11_NODE_850_length_6868_cov_3.543523_3_plen_94_part_00
MRKELCCVQSIFRRLVTLVTTAVAAGDAGYRNAKGACVAPHPPSGDVSCSRCTRTHLGGSRLSLRVPLRAAAAPIDSAIQYHAVPNHCELEPY